MFNRNPYEFSHHFITLDETWIRYNKSETKQPSKPWRTSLPKKAKKGLSGKKHIAARMEISRLLNFQKGITINDEYYVNLMKESTMI